MKTTIQIFILSILTVFIISCFGGNKPSIDPELKDYVDRFNAEALKRNQNYESRIAELDIRLGEIFSSGVLGLCFDRDDRIDAIQIDRSYWELESTTDLEKEFVIFHELGHCVLNRDHLNTRDTMNMNICISMMYDGNSTNCNLDYNEDNRDEMIDELFQ